MKAFSRNIFLAAIAIAAIAPAASAQDEGTGVRRRTTTERTRPGQQPAGPQLSERVKNFYDSDASSSVSDADVQWMRVIYRQIDLNNDRNAALYYPEEPVDGQENLFRIIMRLMANNQLPAYEYLDGREVFTDQYRIKVRDMLDRFQRGALLLRHRALAVRHAPQPSAAAHRGNLPRAPSRRRFRRRGRPLPHVLD